MKKASTSRSNRINLLPHLKTIRPLRKALNQTLGANGAPLGFLMLARSVVDSGIASFIGNWQLKDMARAYGLNSDPFIVFMVPRESGAVEFEVEFSATGKVGFELLPGDFDLAFAHERARLRAYRLFFKFIAGLPKTGLQAGKFGMFEDRSKPDQRDQLWAKIDQAWRPNSRRRSNVKLEVPES
jgi:hypothetical protein